MSSLLAQIYTGGGIDVGVNEARNIAGLATGTLPSVVSGALGRVTLYLTLAATVAITVAGLYLLLGFGDDGSKDKAKKIITYTIAGMAIVIFAQLIVSFAMHLITGTGSDPTPTIFAIMNRIVSYTALLATIAIIIAGFYLILGLGDDSSKETAKKIILYTIVGIIIIGLANIIVSFIYYILNGGGSDAVLRGIVVGFIQRVLSFLSLIATITVIIAGFYLILSLGDDTGKDRAKKIILYTLVGLFVILVSRVIVGYVTGTLFDGTGGTTLRTGSAFLYAASIL